MARTEAYKNRDFRQKVLNVENTTKCTLLCHVCKRTSFFTLNDKPLPGKDLTPEQFKKVVRYFKYITFGGQISDPVFGKHFLKLLKICKDNEVTTKVLTAATGKPKSFYKEAFELNPKAEWTFGIDGPPELSHNYRVNQDGQFLFDMMCMAKEQGMTVYWQYIIFPWNEEFIEICKNKAKRLGIHMIFIQSERT